MTDSDESVRAVLDALEFYRLLGLPGCPGDAGERLTRAVLDRSRPSGAHRRGGSVRPGPSPGGSGTSRVVVEIQDMETADRQGELNDLRNEIGDCIRCKLSAGRKNVVFGVGNPHAALMFIGEGPGADEDARGLPFVGRAGELLTRMIEAMGTKRSQVYIANIVKCRPPGNRDPQPDEIGTCIPFLLRQIGIIRPKVIVTLGRVAVQALLDTKAPISRLRGSFQEFRGPEGLVIPVMPTYHPAYLLRSPGQKKYAWEDLKQVMARLGWETPST